MFPGAPPIPSITGGAGGGSRSGDAAARLTGTSSFDASNWTVATGKSTATGGVNPLVLAAGAAILLVIVWRLTKK